MAKALVFDVDGTLVTFHFDVMGTRRALLDELGRCGFDTTNLGLTTPTQQILDAARAQVESGNVGLDFNDLRMRAYEILDRFELNGAEVASPFPETAPTLTNLAQGGVRMGVLTNSGRKAAYRVLERSGILSFFEFVLTRDDTATLKPRPEGLALAVQRLGLSPSEVIYVGDSPFDIAAAKAAGVRVISVATGNYDAEKLKAEGADFVVSSISEVTSLAKA